MSYKETIVTKSNQICLAKSPNKMCRIWMSVKPLNESTILNGETWSSGSSENVLLNRTKGVLVPDDVKEAIIASFLEVIEKGPFVGYPLRGVCFVIYDIMIRHNLKCKTSTQLKLASFRCMYASLLTAKPGIYVLVDEEWTLSTDDFDELAKKINKRDHLLMLDDYLDKL